MREIKFRAWSKQFKRMSDLYPMATRTNDEVREIFFHPDLSYDCHMNDKYIIIKGKYEEATIECIRDTVRMFKEFITKHDPLKPTCNQELYVRDVEFLLEFIKTNKDNL